MYQTKLKALAVSALLITAASSAPVNAASQQFDVTFTTIADLSITQVQAMSFGTQVYNRAGGICIMNAAVPGSTLMNYANGATVNAANFGDLTGTGCVNGTGGTPGVYEVAGVPGLSVNITVNGITGGTNFDFAPTSGCITTYNNANDGDTCDAFTPGAALPRTLATAGDGGTGGTPVAGRLRIAVGGQITIGTTDLTANTAYTQQFTIDAIY